MAVFAAGLPKWQFLFCGFFLLTSRYHTVESAYHRWRKTMLKSFEYANQILAELAEQGTLEPMIEPIDDPSLEVNYWDWADVIGVVDDLIPEEYTV
jgi:hypothetical protein